MRLVVAVVRLTTLRMVVLSVGCAAGLAVAFGVRTVAFGLFAIVVFTCGCSMMAVLGFGSSCVWLGFFDAVEQALNSAPQHKHNNRRNKEGRSEIKVIKSVNEVETKGASMSRQASA